MQPVSMFKTTYESAILIIPRKHNKPLVYVGMFTRDRLTSLPTVTGFRTYNIRHLSGDVDCGIEISTKQILVDFMGTFVTRERIPRRVLTSIIASKSTENDEEIWDSYLYVDEEFTFDPSGISNKDMNKAMREFINTITPILNERYNDYDKT